MSIFTRYSLEVRPYARGVTAANHAGIAAQIGSPVCAGSDRVARLAKGIPNPVRPYARGVTGAYLSNDERVLGSPVCAGSDLRNANGWTQGERFARMRGE